MNGYRAEFVQRKIELQLARHRAKREHDQPCDCPYCITQDRIEERLAVILAAQRAAVGEPPF